MPPDLADEVAREMAWMIFVGGKQIREPNAGVDPIGQKHAFDPAGESHVPVRIVQAVISAETSKMRWVLNSHEPLQHAVIGLADAPNLAIRPGLLSDPFDDVVQVLLFGRVHESEFAFGEPSA